MWIHDLPLFSYGKIGPAAAVYANKSITCRVTKHESMQTQDSAPGGGDNKGTTSHESILGLWCDVALRAYLKADSNFVVYLLQSKFWQILGNTFGENTKRSMEKHLLGLSGSLPPCVHEHLVIYSQSYILV